MSAQAVRRNPSAHSIIPWYQNYIYYIAGFYLASLHLASNYDIFRKNLEIKSFLCQNLKTN